MTGERFCDFGMGAVVVVLVAFWDFRLFLLDFAEVLVGFSHDWKALSS